MSSINKYINAHSKSRALYDISRWVIVQSNIVPSLLYLLYICREDIFNTYYPHNMACIIYEKYNPPEF